MNAGLEVTGTNTEMNIAENSIGIWFTQAHSCQRDLILAAKQVLTYLAKKSVFILPQNGK